MVDVQPLVNRCLVFLAKNRQPICFRCLYKEVGIIVEPADASRMEIAIGDWVIENHRLYELREAGMCEKGNHIPDGDVLFPK